MAKTLVGLYDTFAEAEHVVEDLVQHGFDYNDIRLATHDSAGRHATATMAEHLVDDSDLFEQLTDLGVPADEAHTYTEGVRQGRALVIVEAGDDMADRGLEIMRRSYAAAGHTRDTLLHQEERARVAPYAVAQTKADGRQERQGRRETNREATTIPVVEEEISVGKRDVGRGKVRVHTHVEEQPVEESVRLREEKVVVERHPVDRPATEADLQAAQDKTIEMTETVEEPVVSKRARVVEEVTVHKEARERTETVRDKVRRKEVDIEGVKEGAHTVAGTGFETYAADFRRHHTTTYAGSGTYYEDYEPAYRYGYDLGCNERYRDRDWDALEADARRDWEVKRPGTWERFKAAIRYGWDKVRGRV